MEIRRFKDAGITMGEGHDNLTELADRCLRRLANSGLGYALKDKDVVIIIVDPKEERTGVGCGVHGDSESSALAGLVATMMSSLGWIGKLVPHLRPIILDGLRKKLSDG